MLQLKAYLSRITVIFGQYAYCSTSMHRYINVTVKSTPPPLTVVVKVL